VCGAVCGSLNTELEREKMIRVEAENKWRDLQAGEVQQQQRIFDLENQIHDLEAAKVGNVLFHYVVETSHSISADSDV